MSLRGKRKEFGATLVAVLIHESVTLRFIFSCHIQYIAH
jgi:hypothetical protein